MIKVVNEPIVPASLLEVLDREGAGSMVFHVGIVKSDPEGKKSRGISLEAGPDAESELKEIEDRVRSNYDVVDIVLVRRMGDLDIGDFILFAAASANDRVNAFGACRELVEGCKKMKALKKTEHLVE